MTTHVGTHPIGVPRRVRASPEMPPKGHRGGGRGGGAPASPTSVIQDSLVREFRAITGADAALAERALRLARGDLSAAVGRFFSIADTSEPAPQPPGKRLTQPNLHESKLARGAPRPEATSTRTDGDGDAGGNAFPGEAETRDVLERFAAALPRRPEPDAAGWVASVPQALESEMETREVALAWATDALEMTSAAPAGERRRFEDAAFPADASSIDGKRAGAKRANATSETSATRVTECHCGIPASIKEVFKDGKNQGRWFYACGTRRVSRFAKEKTQNHRKEKEKEGCSFFAWADDAPSSERARATRWRRFDPPRFRLTSETRSGAPRFRPCDVRQGAVGDCWLLSALAVIAERADLVDRLVLATRGESLAAGDAVAARAHVAGAYFLRLFLDGKWRGVVVDPRLPVRGVDTQVLRGANAAGSRKRKADADEDEFQPAYSRASGNQLWVPLVEKAHAKAHGSYHAISGGWISEGLLDLTGCPTETLRLRGIDDDATWARLLSYASARFPMGCATDWGDAARGIVGGHAYSVMDVREVRGLTVGRQTTLAESLRAERRKQNEDGVAEAETIPAPGSMPAADETLRLVRVRNPWGRKEWNGEWGTGSEVWTKKLGAELGHVRADDGTFWMSFRDFVTRFSRVDVCKAHEGWFVNSLEMASSGAAFELELASGLTETETKTETETAASWAYVMALQKSKRGRGSAGFWYDDWHVAIYVRDAVCDAWAPVTAAAGARERDSQMEVMFEPGVRYLVRAYSFARERSGEKSPNHRHRDAATRRTDAAPATLRVYSARKLRVRPAKFPAGGSPSLAPAIHAGMFDSRDSLSTTNVVERKTTRVCGGAVVVCRTRGGAHVFAVNASSAELRVRLAVRARGGADVYQHPAPLVRRAAEKEPLSRGGRYRYVPPGETAPGTVSRRNDAKEKKKKILAWSEHAVPAGRARLLAVAVATGPSESRRHALDVRVAAVGAPCAACAAREARRASAAEAEDARTKPGGSHPLAEFGLPPPPPGTTDEALAAALAAAIAEAAASEVTGGILPARDDHDLLVVDDDADDAAEDEEEEEEDEVVFVKETGTTSETRSPFSEYGDASFFGSSRHGAPGAPPAALLTLFAHVPASAFAKKVAMGDAETRDACAEIV